MSKGGWKSRNSNRFLFYRKGRMQMTNEKKKKNKKIKFEIKRVYVGEKPIGEVFEGVIEHIAMKNLENTKEDKRTQA